MFLQGLFQRCLWNLAPPVFTSLVSHLYFVLQRASDGIKTQEMLHNLFAELVLSYGQLTLSLFALLCSQFLFDVCSSTCVFKVIYSEEKTFISP